MQIWRVAVSMVVLSMSGAVRCQTSDNASVSARLGEVAQAYATQNDFAGTVLVTRDQEVLLEKNFGSANRDWQIPNTPDVRFRIGSLTKQFTAALVLLLQQDGKLNVNDTVSKYLPNLPATWAKITLTNLLGHTSGIPDLMESPDFEVWAMSAHTPAEEVSFIARRPLEFQPGLKFSYSSSNYIILGSVLEKVSGVPFAKLLNDKIVVPLALSGTGVDADDLILPKRATGYVQEPLGLGVARSGSLTVPYSAGSMYSTAADLLTWERALFEHNFLTPASLTMMTTPSKGDYGFGLFIVSSKGVTILFHNGGTEGFSARLAYVPERKTTVIALANIANASPQMMGDDLAQVALGRSVILPTERKEVPIYATETPKFAGTFELGDGSAVRLEAQGNTLQGTIGGLFFQLAYLGLQEGHPSFFLRELNGVLEFLPGENDQYNSFILHRGGVDEIAKRH